MPLRRLLVFRRPYRHARRYQRIVSVLFKHGFGDILVRLELDSYFNLGRFAKADQRWGAPEPRTRGERLRRVFEELGPTFIKLGQVLSTHSDILPRDVIAELEKLQDNVPPFPYEEARHIIKEDLGGPPEELFAEFDQKPLAAASIGQVHPARLKSGEEVVVKVLRPNIRRVVEVDLEILAHLAELMERHLEGWAVHSPTRIVDELARHLHEETDFEHEASYQEQFAGQFIHDAKAHVPVVYRRFCSSRLLTMERIGGVKPRSAEVLRQNGLDPRQVARRGFKFLLKQIFLDGFFHADPHPGNLKILPGNVICYLDFGMMGRLSRRQREQFAHLVMAIANRNEVEAAEAFTRLAEWDEVPDHEELEKALDAFMDRHFHKSLKEMDIGGLLHELVDIVVSFKMRFPEELLLVIKALTTVEGLGRELDPEFDPIALAKPFLTKMRWRRLEPRRLYWSSIATIEDYLRLWTEFPQQAREIMRQLKRGQVAIEFNVKGLEPLLNTLDRVSNRLALAVMVGALVIGSSLLVHAGIPPLWNGVPLIGIAGYAIAFFLSLGLIFSILREGKH